MTSGNDLTIAQEKFIPWQHEMKPAGYLYVLCLNNLIGASENSHISAVDCPTRFAGLHLELRCQLLLRSAKLQKSVQEIAASN